MSERRQLLDHDIAEVWLSENDVLEFRYKVGVTVDYEGARDVVGRTVEALESLGPRPTIVFVGDVRKVTRDAREFFARDPMNAQTSSRLALLGTSAVGRMVANFFLGLNRPDTVEVRLFKSPEDALPWLMQG